MPDVLERALDMLKTDKCVFQVLQTIGAASIAVTGADLSNLSVDTMLALLKLLDAAEQKIQEITQSRL